MLLRIKNSYKQKKRTIWFAFQYFETLRQAQCENAFVKYAMLYLQ